ncbi:hypothetical protein [Photorhabdus sp. SF281]|uniref:hypothetical protein n=1 Tax=Photorhabdus sp. SF281 TaxID=3459527 RepID=UPI00404449D4
MITKQYDKAPIHVGNNQVISGKTDSLGTTLAVQSEAEENLQLSSPKALSKSKKTLYEVSNNTPVEYVMEFMEK